MEKLAALVPHCHFAQQPLALHRVPGERLRGVRLWRSPWRHLLCQTERLPLQMVKPQTQKAQQPTPQTVKLLELVAQHQPRMVKQPQLRWLQQFLAMCYSPRMVKQPQLCHLHHLLLPRMDLQRPLRCRQRLMQTDSQLQLHNY